VSFIGVVVSCCCGLSHAYRVIVGSPNRRNASPAKPIQQLADRALNGVGVAAIKAV
jgi:hypothetical protein